VLIATLGAEPQVISLTTQLLLQQQETLAAVVVLHTHIDCLRKVEATFARLSDVEEARMSAAPGR
jgi:hypothetical protein